MSKLVEESAQYITFGSIITEGKLNSSNQKELERLIYKVIDMTDPEYEGQYNDGGPESSLEKVLSIIKNKFGEKIAKDVAGIEDKTHFGRHPRNKGNSGHDELKSKTHRYSPGGGEARIKKDGKIDRRQIQARMNRIKQNLKEKGLLK